MDDEVLAFVVVSARIADEGGFSEGGGLEGRGCREVAAIACLAEHEGANRPVRFDSVSLAVFGGDEAFLRRRINVLFDATPIAGISLPSGVV